MSKIVLEMNPENYQPSLVRCVSLIGNPVQMCTFRTHFDLRYIRTICLLRLYGILCLLDHYFLMVNRTYCDNTFCILKHTMTVLI